MILPVSIAFFHRKRAMHGVMLYAPSCRSELRSALANLGSTTAPVNQTNEKRLRNPR